MKQYISIIKNWRIVALTVAALVAMLLIFCDGDDLGALVCVKVIGIALASGCWRVADQWEAAGLINELHVFNDDHEET